MLESIPVVRLYAGSDDECGHQHALTELKQELDSLDSMPAGVVMLQIFPGVTHGTIGQAIDLEEFWRDLQVARRVAEQRA